MEKEEMLITAIGFLASLLGVVSRWAYKLWKKAEERGDQLIRLAKLVIMRGIKK